jgi:hypothetical protein
MSFSLVDFHRLYGGKYCVLLQGRRVNKQVTTQKRAENLATVRSSETSVNLRRCIRSHVVIIHSRCYDNFNSYT